MNYVIREKTCNWNDNQLTTFVDNHNRDVRIEACKQYAAVLDRGKSVGVDIWLEERYFLGNIS